MFKDKTLDFLGLSDIAPIAEPLRTENVEIIIKSEFVDMAFVLKDNSGIHFEEEVQLSRDDLKRIGSYNLWLSREYKLEFITVIFVKEPTNIRNLKTEQMLFEPRIVQCSKIDADAMLAKLKTDIAKGKEVNELEIIYLPLFASKEYSPTELFIESTALIKDLSADEDLKMKLYALSIVLAGKVVDKAELEKLWEEVKLMRNVILEYAEERGIKLGEERGIKLGEERKEEKAARRMLAKGYDMEEIAEITDISLERLRELN